MRAVVLCLLLAGCATTNKTVPVPTPVSCVRGDVPDEPGHVSDRLTGNAEADIGIVAGSAVRLRAWGRELRAIVEGCR